MKYEPPRQFSIQITALQQILTALMAVNSQLTLRQWHILFEICRNNLGTTRFSVTMVSRQSGISKPVISRALNTLEDQGYVRRCQDRNDGRKILVELREKGRQAIRSAVDSSTSMKPEGT